MQLTRRALAALAAVVTLASLACGSDGGPSGPETVNPIVGVTATADGATSVTVSFTGNVGDASYDIERAEGAAGAFAAAGNVAAPATGGAVTFKDANLKANTAYRYRVIVNKGSLKSVPSGEAAVTTSAFGTKSAIINTDIVASRTLYADTAYTLSGFIHVGNAATLTIQAGTTIKGDFNTLGSSLMILKGAKIIAIGTADAPIVFTSSRAVGQRQPGDWGGLLLVGNAPNNRSGQVAVEGTGTDAGAPVPGKNYTVIYNGGNIAADNSGTLQYVRVEFGGYAPVADQEFNAFTFCAIGSGTRASYLQALAGLDDSYEFFGCNGPGCDLGFNSAPFTIPLVSNFTLIGCGLQTCMGPSGGHGMMLRRGTGGYYVNGVVARWSADGISLRDSATFARGGTSQTPSATADLQIRNVLFAETNGKVFQTPVNAASNPQSGMDLTANNLTLSGGTAASLFTLIPAVGAAPTSIADFDFSPAASSAIATGGLATFTGAILAKAGTVVTPTAYLGAVAPGGTKWWQGWTSYARN